MTLNISQAFRLCKGIYDKPRMIAYKDYNIVEVLNRLTVYAVSLVLFSVHLKNRLVN
jgi:hypothetical protein